MCETYSSMIKYVVNDESKKFVKKLAIQSAILKKNLVLSDNITKEQRENNKKYLLRFHEWCVKHFCPPFPGRGYYTHHDTCFCGEDHYREIEKFREYCNIKQPSQYKWHLEEYTCLYFCPFCLAYYLLHQEILENQIDVFYNLSKWSPKYLLYKRRQKIRQLKQKLKELTGQEQSEESNSWVNSDSRISSPSDSTIIGENSIEESDYSSVVF